MPRGDGTGPAGMGPMTGRATGYCVGYSGPGDANPAGGGGVGFMGRGCGGGWGRRNWFGATGLPGRARADMGYLAWGGGADPAAPVPAMTAEQEIEGLRQQAEYLGKTLAEINKRIEELGAGSGE